LCLSKAARVVVEVKHTVVSSVYLRTHVLLRVLYVLLFIVFILDRTCCCSWCLSQAACVADDVVRAVVHGVYLRPHVVLWVVYSYMLLFMVFILGRTCYCGLCTCYCSWCLS
jgi:hypothetical protein